jgi:hypothetical protein
VLKHTTGSLRNRAVPDSACPGLGGPNLARLHITAISSTRLSPSSPARSNSIS